MRALLLLSALSSSAVAATGGTAVTLNHSGYLLSATDQPVEAAALPMTFRVVTLATGGVVEWEATCSAVAVNAGYFAVQLGAAGSGCTGTSADPLLETSDLPPTDARWLEVEVDGVALTPRVLVSVAPNATLAFDAQKLGGALPATFHDAALLTGTVPAAALGAGSTGLTTVGTITAGTWQGTPIADARIASAAAWNAKLSTVAHDGTLTGDGTVGSGSLGVNVGTTPGSVASGADARFGQWSGTATGLTAATGRTSLGLGTAATTDATAYATAAQGAKADAALPAAGGTVTGVLTLPGTGSWTATGRLGIGTSAPATALEVHRQILVTGNTGAGAEYQDWPNPSIMIRRSDDYVVNGVTMMSFGFRSDPTYDTTSSVANIRLYDPVQTAPATTSASTTILKVGSPGALSLGSGGVDDRLYLTPGARLGLGTLTPRAALEVSSAGGAMMVTNTGSPMRASTLIYPWATSGTFTGDILIDVQATSWKSVTYNIGIAAASTAVWFSGGFYDNGGISGPVVALNGANGTIGAPTIGAITTQGFRISIPILGSITHPTVQLTLGMGGDNVLRAEDVTITVN